MLHMALLCKYFGFYRMIQVSHFVECDMIHYVSMSTNDVNLTGSLFQLVLYHVHSSVSTYLGLALFLFKEMVNSIIYILWLSGLYIVSTELAQLKCNCC